MTEPPAEAANAPPATPLTTMRRLNLLLLAVASVALFLMLKGTEWGSLTHSLLRSKYYWPLLVVPYGVTSLLWSLSWRAILVGDLSRPPLHRLFSLRLGGEALNQLTPTGSIGGEPFKAVRLVASGVGWREATASVVIHKAVAVVSLVLYILVGLLLIPVTLPDIPPRLALFSCLGTTLLASGGFAFLFLQRGSPCLSLIKALKRLGICPAVLAAKEDELAALDQTLARFYRDHHGALLMAVLFFFLGWLLHACETYLIFRLLGHPVTIPVAVCLDALSQLAAGLGFMVPVSLGVQDGGNIFLSLGFNLGKTLGAGFAVLRRLREAFWLILGLVVVAREK